MIVHQRASDDRRFGLVSFAALGGITILLAAMLARVAQLQLAPSAALADQMKPRVSEHIEPAIRGDVRDDRDRVISTTRFGQRVILDPTLLPRDRAETDRLIVKLAPMLGLDADHLGDQVHNALAENERRDAVLDLAGREKPVSGLRGLLPAWAQPAKPVTPIKAVISRWDQRTDEPPGVIRYLPVSEVLPDEKIDTVKAFVKAGKIKCLGFERRPVREYPGGDLVAGIVGLVGVEQKGMMGAEHLLNDELKGKPGYIAFVRDRAGHPMSIEPGQAQPAAAGHDIRLSIDLELQRICTEELRKQVEDLDAAGGRLVLADPLTGEILAMVDIVRHPADAEPFPWMEPLRKDVRGRVIAGQKDPNPFAGRHRYVAIRPDNHNEEFPALARNRCVEDVYEPGSTFKAFVWSTITELGLARTDEVFNTEHGHWVTSYGRKVDDVHKGDFMTWSNVLVNSSNIGMTKAAERMSFKQLHDTAVKFGFGKPTGLGLPGEASGLVTPLAKWTKYSQTSYAFGYEVAVTPVQMVRAFSAFCRTGELAGTLAQLHLTAVDPSSDSASPRSYQQGVIYRVLPAEIAALTRETMQAVAGSMETKYCPPPPGGWRYTIFGKSGTANVPMGDPPKDKRSPRGTRGYLENQYNSSFIAAGPIENPRLEVIVVIDDPGPDVVARRHYFGAACAGPVVRNVLERALTYLGVPPSKGTSEQ